MAKFESLDPEIHGVLGKKVSELGLRVEGSPVEGYVRQLYSELERRGLKKFRPVCYLTDEWGCPDQQPVLGIPFYLADSKLRKLEKAVDVLETERQIMMYMRHEAGHVFNYAYVERVARALADVEPIVNGQIFLTRRRKESKPAADIVSRHKTELVEKITYWTGVQRPIVRGLIDSICRTCERMKLWGELGEEARYLVEVTALATTLAMNFLTRGRFES